MAPDNTGIKLKRFGNHENIAAFLGVLVRGGASIRELADQTDSNYATICALVRHLHRAGALHIGRWRVDSLGRESIAVYELGMGVDAPKRKPKTAAERSLKYIRKRQRVMPATGDAGRIRNSTLDMALRGWSVSA